MADGNSKKKRNPKTSQGKHGGGGKVKLSRGQLMLMGRGPSAKVAESLFLTSKKGSR